MQQHATARNEIVALTIIEGWNKDRIAREGFEAIHDYIDANEILLDYYPKDPATGAEILDAWLKSGEYLVQIAAAEDAEMREGRVF